MPPIPAALHSIPAEGICAENDMSAGTVATPSSANRAVSCRVVALVEGEKARVDAVRPTAEGDVDGVRMAAEVIASLVERHAGGAGEDARRCETGDSRADDGDALHPLAAGRQARPPGAGRRCAKKGVAERPRGNEGGRREEENPPRISAGKTGRLRDENRFVVPAPDAAPGTRGGDARCRTRRISMTRLGATSSRRVSKSCHFQTLWQLPSDARRSARMRAEPPRDPSGRRPLHVGAADARPAAPPTALGRHGSGPPEPTD